MINPISFLDLLYLLIFSSLDWGKTGHQVEGALAQQQLKSITHKAFDVLLDSASLAFISTYADEIKYNPKYRALRTWHYINLPVDLSYSSEKKIPKGML